jgi:hypothetical protein
MIRFGNLFEDKNIDKLRKYLNDSGISDREISGGLDLKKIGYAKIAAAMDVSEEDAENLLDDLSDFLKKKASLEESYAALVEKDDDTEDDDDDDFHAEIHAKYNTFNFLWIYDDMNGSGTARFSDKGVKVMSIRDSEGKVILKFPSKDFVDSIQRQAIDFIHEA